MGAFLLMAQWDFSEWSTTAAPSSDFTDALVYLTALAALFFLVYGTSRFWRDWESVFRVLALVGLGILAGLGTIVLRELHDPAFRSGFLANYVVALTVFILGFFVVEQFLEAQRARAVFQNYLPLVAHELLADCSALARCMALVRLALFEGYESVAGQEPISLQVTQASWDHVQTSGGMASFIPGRAELPHGVDGILREFHKGIVRTCAFEVEDLPEIAELVGWSYGFASDISRAYELIKSANLAWNRVDLSKFPINRIGMLVPSVLQNPQSEEDRALVQAHSNAIEFCRSASNSVVFSCFAIHQMATIAKVRGPKSGQIWHPSDPQEIIRLALSLIPRSLLRREVAP